tara:strand:- start:7125 stop:7772 length:648 start_codon:yes stop_codon:yes gene_type:complete
LIFARKIETQPIHSGIGLSHSDIDVLEKASQALLAEMNRFETARDVSDDYNKGKSQLDFTLLPEGRALGLTSAEVGQQVRDAFYGALALRQLRGTNEVEVRVKLPLAERQDIHHLEELVILTPAGTEVPLLDVLQVERGEAFTTINRNGNLYQKAKNYRQTTSDVRFADVFEVCWRLRGFCNRSSKFLAIPAFYEHAWRATRQPIVAFTFPILKK